MALFDEMLGGGNIPIESITAFYNPTLTSSFVNAWNISNQRFSSTPSLFSSNTVKSFAKERKWILSEYDRKVHYYDWNSALILPIVPSMLFLRLVFLFKGCHGTDQYIGEKIAETGFIALSSTDGGFFGKGIYCTLS
jgi:hypothetical protein